MPLPPEIDERIRKRFEELLRDAHHLDNAIFINKNTQSNARHSELVRLKVNVLSLLNLLKTSSDYIIDLIDDIRKDTNPSATELKGIISGLKSDYEAGMLVNLSRIVEANVSADYLGQAEQLLKEGQSGKYDHVPAAVLTGAILEDALRRLCQRQNPPIPLVNTKGEPKTLNPLIDDLKKANIYNELKAKQLRSWADIRNAAAHGEFGNFTRHDVEQMLLGVQNFLANYL
jgi:hypothetical protein